MLHETIANMDEEESKYHMKRCIDSGLWIPDANKKKDGEEETPTVNETAKNLDVD